MTETELEMLYEKHTDHIRSIVWQFMRKMGMKTNPAEFEEQCSRANLYFVLATTTYDGKLSEFSTWLHIQISKRLLNEHLRKGREWERLDRLRERYVSNDAHTPTRPPIWQIVDGLSDDSKFLLTLICNGKLDTLLFYDDGSLVKRTYLIKSVFRFLKEYGWRRVRIRRCFKNIRHSFIGE